MSADYAPGSIVDVEQRWLADQDVPALRGAIYERLPIVIAANDLEGRKPFLALERLVELVLSGAAVEGTPPETGEVCYRCGALKIACRCAGSTAAPSFMELAAITRWHAVARDGSGFYR